MTRNRNRKNTIRANRDVRGSGYAEAARVAAEGEQRRRSVHELLAEASGALRVVDVADTAETLRRTWTVVCLIGAAGQILAQCADRDDFLPRWLLAQPQLTDAVTALRSIPELRGHSTVVNPAGDPDERLADMDAAVIHDALIQAAETLHSVLEPLAPDARPSSAAHACTVVSAAARDLADRYRAPKAPWAVDQTAGERPAYLPAITPDELRVLINTHVAELRAADPRHTTAAFVATWYAFAVTAALGQYQALRDHNRAILHYNALPVHARVIETMDAAPSLPAGVHGVGLDTAPPSDYQIIALSAPHRVAERLTEEASMRISSRGIWELTFEVNALLPAVARHARNDADRVVAKICTVLAAELADCYTGRLRTFLNPHGRLPGAGSAVIRTKGGRSAKTRPR
jgi:hypothetical protein